MRGKKRKTKRKEKETTQKGVRKMNKGRRNMLTVLGGKRGDMVMTEK